MSRRELERVRLERRRARPVYRPSGPAVIVGFVLGSLFWLRRAPPASNLIDKLEAREQELAGGSE